MCPTPDELDRQTKAALYGPDYASGSLPPAPPASRLPQAFKPTVFAAYRPKAPLPPAPPPAAPGWGCIQFWLSVFFVALVLGIVSLAYVSWLAAGNPGWPELLGFR